MIVSRYILSAVLLGGSAISLLNYQRSIQPAGSSGQHYVVVDETIWGHANPNLDDLRLFAGEKEVPYAIRAEMAASQSERTVLRILQPGTIGRKTQFILDMNGAAEYDRVELQIAARNFVAHAMVEGQDDVHSREWAKLGTTTLYDLTDETLGHNSTLHIPLSAYRYLRVTVDGSIKPSDLEGASSGTTRSEKAIWRDVKAVTARTEKGKDTVFAVTIPPHVPVEQVRIDVEATQPNFRRRVEIRGEQGQILGSCDLSRIHMQRNGQRLDVEETSFATSLRGPGQVEFVVRNGDDPPLQISGVRVQQYERRIYFDFEAGAIVKLYYGDGKLDPPVYDYRKLFLRVGNPDPLQLGMEMLNPAFRGPLDDRPWSERYPALLWATIIAAVLILGGIAFRSIQAANR